MFRAGERQSLEAFERTVRRHPAAACGRRSAGRGRRGACSVSMPLHAGLPDAYRRPAIHPPDPASRRARRGRGRFSTPTSSAAVAPRLPDRSPLRRCLCRSHLDESTVQIGRLQRFACDIAAARLPFFQCRPAHGQTGGRGRLGAGRPELRPRAATAGSRCGCLRGARRARRPRYAWASPLTRSPPSSRSPRSR